MNTTQITVEQIEHLATELEADAEENRSRLLRLIRAETRILAAREPERFTRRACHYGDEAGHYDNSYPPKMEYSERTGPVSITLTKSVTEDVATTSGFYYEWRRVCSSGALALDMHGRFWRSDETGTGRVGQFAAHPGDCGVDVTIDWSHESDDDVSLEELRIAEGKLRALAFPAATAKAAQS